LVTLVTVYTVLHIITITRQVTLYSTPVKVRSMESQSQRYMDYNKLFNIIWSRYTMAILCITFVWRHLNVWLYKIEDKRRWTKNRYNWSCP